MIIIFINTIITNIIIFSFGSTFFRFFFKENMSKNNLSEIPLFGIIFLSFCALIINFLFPLNKTIGTIILIFGLSSFILTIANNNLLYKKIIKNLLLASLISFLLISFSNIYRPDAGLYHLPFVSLLNENKIVIGSANINFRFAITSIIQYLSAIQNNYIFELKSISIPIASIFSFSILFMIQNTKKSFKYKNDINSFIFFLITCFSLISFGRFSNYGNDTVSHLYFLLMIIYIIHNYKDLFINVQKFNKISLISIFLFSTKAFMLMVLLVPLIFFIFNKNIKKIFQNKTSYIFTLFLVAWILRSVMISGCIIYPLDKTCFKNLKIYDQNKTIIEANSGEAWSKDWVNQKDPKLKFSEYNKNFNWLKTWKKTHLIKIVEKLTPFIAFLIILYLVLLKQKNKTTKRIYSEINFICFISLFLFLIWFLKFPLYRYGAAFIATLIILIFIYSMNYFKLIPDINKFKKKFQLFLIICAFAFLTKNILRINNNINDMKNEQWPDIYSENNDYQINNFKLIYKKNEKLYYFSQGKLCMYSKSPCSNYNIKNLDKEKFFIYDVYWIN